MTNGLFGRLRDALGLAKPVASGEPRQLFIDDDAAGGIEVLPASQAAWCMRQMDEIERFAARHELPDGAGWSDIYVRPPAPLTIADLGIPLLPAVEALGRELPRIEEVITGSLAAPRVVHRARAFGPSLLSAVVLYGDGSSPHVQWIELTLRGGETEGLAVLSAMASLPSPEPLMVVDWEQSRTARIDRPDEVQKFASPTKAAAAR